MAAISGWIARTLALLAIVCGWAVANAVDQRVALLIGNNAYGSVPLANAVNDARDLAAALRTLGFKTIVRENATRRDMIEALREFGESVGQGDSAVFFYAGHALQFKDRNYLLPVDAEIRSEDDISLFSVEIQQVFDRMDRARTRHNVIILDACRDNPFASSFKVTSPGLAQSSAPSGTLIAYATAPGSVAADGFGRNGIYTKNILRHIMTPDLPVELMFKRVREAVEKETQSRQTPWDSSSMKGQFVFNTGSAAAQPAPVVAKAEPSMDMMLQIERDFWVSVRDSSRPEELQAYLDNYPNGKFAAIARLRLQQQGGPPGVPPGMPPAVRMQPRGLELPPAQPPNASPPDKSSSLGPPRLYKVAMEPAFGIAPSTEDFFRKPQIEDMQLSPDGSHVAVMLLVGGHLGVAVLDLAKRQAKPVALFDDYDVQWVRWVNKRRLLVRTGSMFDGICGCDMGGGLIAVDADGGDVRVVARALTDKRTLDLAMRPLVFVAALPGDSDDFLAQEYAITSDGELKASALVRVNSRTGRRNLVTLGKPDAGEQERWLLDREAVPRVFMATRKGVTAVYYRAGAEAQWTLIDEVPDEAGDWEPQGIAADGSIYVASSRGRDKMAIVQVEPRRGAAERVVAAHPYVDVEALVFDNGVPVGIRYDADHPGFAWMDDELERIQLAVDQALPGATNELTWSRNRERVMVKSTADRSPGTFYLFDRATGRIEWLAERKPWLKSAALSRTAAVRYKARDGLDIPAYLTLPRNPAASPPPLMVLVHDRPFSAGYSWRFDPEVQQFAAEGYAVLQPNFRGTTRYGWKHLKAGYKQWGRGVVDDVSDGVAWAISKGYVDKDRVCVYGGRFGGYTAIMSLIRNPQAYRCGVAYMPYVDVAALYTVGWSPVAKSDTASHDMREMVGDPDKDRAGFDAISPVEQAARIQAPALLAFGGDDLIVPPEQAARLRSALERNHKKFEWLVFDGQGHYFEDPAARLQFQRSASKFVAESFK